MAITVTPNPAEGTLIAPTTPVTLTVTTSGDHVFRTLVVIASFPSSNTRELIWEKHSGVFNGFYLNANYNFVTGGGNTRTFSVLRDGGWPADVTIEVLAVDDAGNVFP